MRRAHMRVSARSSAVAPIRDGPGEVSSRYSQMAVILVVAVPSSSSSAGVVSVGFLDR
jgi:hypothetical protein